MEERKVRKRGHFLIDINLFRAMGNSKYERITPVRQKKVNVSKIALRLPTLYDKISVKNITNEKNHPKEK